MKTYVVGGAIRDQLLGLPGEDRDYLVVGATPAQMLAAGFKPVGKDFPVFLHPRTGCEYALARTERKTARGYQGFAFHCAPDVTLEDDLRRRDLTINALAREADVHGEPFGPVIDPYGGVADLQAKVFRHVSPAFAEDPVRILRLARFAARFAEFSVAPDTLALCRQLVDSGEVDALVAERVWQELSRGLMEDAPARMLTVLRDAGALAKILPEVDALWGVPQPQADHPEIDCGAHLLRVVEMAARLRGSLPARFAALTHDLGKATTPAAEWPRHLGHEQRSVALVGALCERLRVPNDCKGVAQVVAREHGHLHRSGELGAQALVQLLERCDALRKPQRFDEILLACEADARARAGLAEAPYPQARRLRDALAAAQSIAAGAIAAAHAGADIPAAIHAARVAAVAAQLGIPA